MLSIHRKILENGNHPVSKLYRYYHNQIDDGWKGETGYVQVSLRNININVVLNSRWIVKLVMCVLYRLLLQGPNMFQILPPQEWCCADRDKWLRDALVT